MLKQLKTFFGAQDLTVGSPTTNLLKFSVPLLIGNIAQQLYSTVDSIVIGQYVGDTALAAIGAVMPITFLLLVLFMAIATGAGILVAQYFGAKSKAQLNKAIGTSMTLVFISSVFVMAVAIPLANPILRLIDTPVEILDMAATYLKITFWGILGFAFYNIISGILRGLGDSVTPLLFLLIATGLNIVLDIWFVAGFGWGVAGVAYATIISQAISAILCIIRLLRIKETVSLHWKTLIPDRALTKDLFRIGLPSGMTQAIFSLAMVVVQALTNSMGYQVITTNISVMRIDGFAMMPNFTFGMAITTFVGQNIGARRMDRVEKGSRAAVVMAAGVSTFLTLMLVLFGGSLIRLFTDTPEIIDLGIRAMRILAVGYIAMSFTQVHGGIMRGAGDTMPSMWISLITTVVLRVPIAYLLAAITRSEQWPNGSPDALFISLLISWVLGGIMTYAWYRRGTWKTKSFIRPEFEEEPLSEAAS